MSYTIEQNKGHNTVELRQQFTTTHVCNILIQLNKLSFVSLQNLFIRDYTVKH